MPELVIPPWPPELKPPTVPLPQLPELFKAETDVPYVLQRTFVINTTDRPIKLFRKQGDEFVPISTNDYTVEYHGINYNMRHGYTTTTVSGGATNQNCAITITASFPPDTIFSLHYHFVNDPQGSNSYCPKSQTIKDFMRIAIYRVVEALKPAYIHFGHDEMQQMHTCAECNSVDGMDYEGHKITPNGVLFSNDINFLVDKYDDACEQYHGSFRGKAIIFSDHVSAVQEKTVGAPMSTTPRGGRGGLVSPGRWRINPKVIMMSWNYAVQTDEGIPKWDKYQFILDLVANPGFNVVGASAGYPRYIGKGGTEYRERAGTLLRVLLYNAKKEITEFETYNDLEGTYQKKLYLHRGCIQDPNGLHWFSWSAEGDRKKTYVSTSFTGVILRCELAALRVKGKAWFDYVELQREDPPGQWDDIVDFSNRNLSFETLSSEEEQPFTIWHKPEQEAFDAASDEQVFFDGPREPNAHSCKMHYHGTADKVGGIYQNDTSLSLTGTNTLRVDLKLRTQEVDTGRLHSPWQWVKCGEAFQHGSKKYLGSINTNWSYNGQCLPHNDGVRKAWKTRAGDMAVAEWCWSGSNTFSYRLSLLWWDPFQILEKEVPWE